MKIIERRCLVCLLKFVAFFRAPTAAFIDLYNSGTEFGTFKQEATCHPYLTKLRESGSINVKKGDLI